MNPTGEVREAAAKPADGEAGGPGSERGAMVSTWPHLLFRELLAALLALIVLAVVSIVADAPLEEPADPAHTPNPAKAPWYFVGLQELLHAFDPWIAGVLIPAIIVAGLCAIPYIDPTRGGQGEYAARRRPVAWLIFLVGMAGWFALIAVGMWFRGPGWAWVWPGSAVGPGAPAAAHDLPNALGIPLVLGYFLGGGFWIVRWIRARHQINRARAGVLAFLLLAMAGTAIKIALKMALGIQHLVHFERAGWGL